MRHSAAPGKGGLHAIFSQERATSERLFPAAGHRVSRVSYSPIAYVAAAIAYCIEYSDNDGRDDFSYPTTEEQVQQWFSGRFSGSIDEDDAKAVIGLLSELGLISFDEDPFAGRFIRVDERSFHARWSELHGRASDTPFAKAETFGFPWLRKVFDNNAFWETLNASPRNEHSVELPGGMLKKPEPVVFFIEGSADGQALQHGLDELAEELRTNNEIAAELADDRPRILGEVRASQNLVKAGVARVSAVREVLIKVLREILNKLKEKAVELGVDKLLEIAVRLAGG